jgi:hypothetical protein
MKLNGEILDTVYCENNDVLKGTLLDIRFCALNNANIVTHEVRRDGQNIVKRERTGKVTMTCDLSNTKTTIYDVLCTGTMQWHG